MILVVGATGMVGAEICACLVAEGKPVRALVRNSADPAKVNRLARLGVAIARGDLRDRRSLDEACRGASAVIATASSMPFAYLTGQNTPKTVDHDGMLDLVAAAKRAGFGHFIYTSFTDRIDAAFPLRDAKRAVEQRLRESGLVSTILRPNFFMEVWLSPMVGFDYANARATIFGAGGSAISWIALGDVVEFAVASLTHPAAQNATLELGGPEALSPLEVVAIIERVSGCAFAIDHIPEEALAARQAAATDPMEQSFAALQRAYAAGAATDMRPLRAFPVALTSVETYARRVLAAQPTTAALRT